jgi:hypothetical protein
VEFARRLSVSGSRAIPESEKEAAECADCADTHPAVHRPAYQGDEIAAGTALFEALSALAWGNDPGLDELVCVECGLSWPCESALANHS